MYRQQKYQYLSGALFVLPFAILYFVYFGCFRNVEHHHAMLQSLMPLPDMIVHSKLEN